MRPFLCPGCGATVRGDLRRCVCGERLTVNSFTLGEQHSEDMETAGLCEVCERPLAVCDLDPCVLEEEGES